MTAEGKKPRVVLRDQPHYNKDEIAKKAAEIIQSLGIDPSGKSVFVKPSFVYPSQSPAVLGVITQPAFVAGVCMAMRELGAKRIMVGESSVFGPSRVSFQSVGVLPLIKGIAEPVYLDEEEMVEVEVEEPFVQGRFRVPKPFLDADLYVSLPKIKTNMFAEVTLSVKNNLGLLRQRDRLVYHDHRLHKKLADLFRVRPPDLVLSDCIVAGEGQGPMMAEPVELGLMLGGNNAVAVDVVACSLTGYDPSEIEHLKLLIDAGMGPASTSDIEIDGEELLARGRKFRRPDASIISMSPKIRVFQGKEMCCSCGCQGLIRGSMDAYVLRDGPDGVRRMNIILGKPVEDLPDDLDPEITLVLGDCAEEHRDRGEYVGGCCPRPLDIGLVIRRIMGPIEVELGLPGVMRAYTGHNLWRMYSMVSGRKLQPIENHLSFGRVVKEYLLMSSLSKKGQDIP